MTTVHDDVLELAAAAIDFDLSPSERAILEGHLDGCVQCRRRVAGLHGDQRSIIQQPPFVLAPASAERVRYRVRRSGPAGVPALRLIAIAAVLTLLALAAIAVGAEVLRRDHDLDLSVVPPTQTVPVATPSGSILPGPSRRPGDLVAGTTVDVVATGLRVRTAPTVDNSKSAKLDPLLGPGTQLQVLSGPVHADDYDWYEVQAIGLPHRGWVAAADHDGAPWIEARTAAASPTQSFSAAEAALVAGLRADAAVGCTPRRTDLPPRSVAGVDCRINAGQVARVGAYGFGGAADATTAYLQRLASYDVLPASGDCATGKVGDKAWMSGDGTSGSGDSRVTMGETGPWVVGRSGCFLDADGTANVRATCGSTYIGVLGSDADLAALHRWVWADANGQRGPGEPPGICL